jgi:glycosyltransferase involved in cell wall biosynthesis
MINFVWPPGTRLPAGTGGSENYTIGQVRELIRRGIPAQVITIGLGELDGRNEFIDIPFVALNNQDEIAAIDGTVVFINGASEVQTKEPASIIMHIPPPEHERGWISVTKVASGRTVIVPSKYAAQLWADYLHRDLDDIHIAYPFAEPCFATQVRKPNKKATVRVLFAGRLSAQKGIYTFLEMLHIDSIKEKKNLVFSVTTAGSDKPEGKIIRMLVEAHPSLTVIHARKTPAKMAALLSGQDIVVMPSNSQYWHETFGIVSVEAQHSGCWVVASDDGGLPETNCGGVILVKPDDAQALANGIDQAIQNGAPEQSVRRHAANLFTVEQSVDNLLRVLFPQEELVVQPIEKVILKSSIKLI